ncbi:MAG: ribosome silencing factor [Clostridiales Family XIII bacterium]|jgi:ribosome-associated protein|nr:ribosome silencing factor [Clostridiales Family XIII bacterium]
MAGRILDDKKAVDITVIDIAEQSSFADFFVNATAGNARLLSALTDEVEDQLAKEGVIPKNIEGRPESGWILMDYGDIIVNVFLPEQREMYQIEKIWSDGKRVELRIEN